jgi:hypothetical protein
VAARTLDFDRRALIEAVRRHVHGLHLHVTDGTVDARDPIRADSWAFGPWRELDAISTVEAYFEDVQPLLEQLSTFER